MLWYLLLSIIQAIKQLYLMKILSKTNIKKVVIRFLNVNEILGIEKNIFGNKKILLIELSACQIVAKMASKVSNT